MPGVVHDGRALALCLPRRGDHPELLEHAELVRLDPVFGDLSILEAQDVDGRHREGLAPGWDTHDVAPRRPVRDIARHYLVTLGDHVLDRDAQAEQVGASEGLLESLSDDSIAAIATATGIVPTRTIARVSVGWRSPHAAARAARTVDLAQRAPPRAGRCRPPIDQGHSGKAISSRMIHFFVY